MVDEVIHLKRSRKIVRDTEPLEAKLEEFARAIDGLEKSYIETTTELVEYMGGNPSHPDAENQEKLDLGGEFVQLLADDWLFCTGCCKYRTRLLRARLIWAPVIPGMHPLMHYVCKRCIQNRSQDYDWDPWDEPHDDLLPFYHPLNPLRRCTPRQLLRKTKCSGCQDRQDGHSGIATTYQS